MKSGKKQVIPLKGGYQNADVAADKIGAEFKDGILTVEVPKPESRNGSPSIDTDRGTGADPVPLF